MLAEIQNTRQVAGEGFRRWFTDDYFDLIVWYGNDNALLGFQLCYDKQRQERALTWTTEHGFQHNRIDAGEVPGHAKMTPLIIADGAFNRDPVAERFRRESAALDPVIATFVYAKLKEYPAASPRGSGG
ncbi:MAG: hypothetical protein ABSG63_04605 [Spirochaetia bacterium]|jgi:hypothetical protein